MRILWLNAGLLLPLDKGGKLRTWHLMRHLARRHQITYLSFADPATSAADKDGMREVCERLEIVPQRHAAKGSLGFYAGAAASIVDPLPYAAGRYRSRAYAHDHAEVARDGIVRSRRVRLPRTVGQYAAHAAVPVRGVHPQCRGRDLAPSLRAADRSDPPGAVPSAVASNAAIRGLHPGAVRF
jgi:hypothetical protein